MVERLTPAACATSNSGRSSARHWRMVRASSSSVAMNASQSSRLAASWLGVGAAGGQDVVEAQVVALGFPGLPLNVSRNQEAIEGLIRGQKFGLIWTQIRGKTGNAQGTGCGNSKEVNLKRIRGWIGGRFGSRFWSRKGPLFAVRIGPELLLEIGANLHL